MRKRTSEVKVGRVGNDLESSGAPINEGKTVGGAHFVDTGVDLTDTCIAAIEKAASEVHVQLLLVLMHQLIRRSEHQLRELRCIHLYDKIQLLPHQRVKSVKIEVWTKN